MEQGLNRNVGEALALFADELSALRYLERILWPNGVCCPHCGELGKVGKLNGAWWNLSPADNGEDIAFATTLAFAAAEAIARPFQALYDPHSSAGDPVVREQRKLAGILAADVVGYSRLMGGMRAIR